MRDDQVHALAPLDRAYAPGVRFSNSVYGGAVEIAGTTQLQFIAGASSQGAVIPALANRAHLDTNGVDVTAQLVPPN